MWPAGLVGLGFEGEAVAVVVVHGVLAEEIEGVAEVLEALGWGLCRRRIRRLRGRPEDVGGGAEFGAQVHGGHGFLDGEGADPGVAGGEGSVLKMGSEKRLVVPWGRRGRWI